MKRFILFCALAFNMLYANAVTYEIPAPYTDVGNTYIQVNNDNPYEAQAINYGLTCYDFSAVVVLPIFYELQFEEDITEYLISDFHLQKVDLYASSDPPDSYSKVMNGNGSNNLIAHNKSKEWC